MAFDDNLRELSLGELENANTDRSVNPAVMVRGIMGRTSAGSWVYLGSDAGNFRVSSLGGTFSLSADASGNRVSAIQQDAGLLHVSGFSPDAGLFRISSIGGSLSLSADASGNRVSAIQADSSNLHISSYGGYTVGNNISAYGSLLHLMGGADNTSVIRAIITDSSGQPLIAQGDAGKLHTSAFVDSGSVSAKSGDAGQFHVSSAQGDAGLLHMSAFVDSGSVSAKSADANQFHTSSVQGDAGLQHVSSYFGVDTTGQWTIGRLSNLSSSGNIKSTAGTLYGYYAYNTTTIPAYINFTNTSGAINVGTDTVLFKVMLPASAAANVGFPGGLKGFTAGIGAYATSAIADNATTPVATSAVGINVFYN